MFASILLSLLTFGTTLAYAEGGSDVAIVPFIGIEGSAQKTSAIESNILSLQPGVIYQVGDTTGLATLSLSYSANTVNTTNLPSLKSLQIADTTDYQLESHTYTEKHAFTGVIGGTKFDDKISTETYVDIAYLDFSRKILFSDNKQLYLGAGLLYLRDNGIVIPFPVIAFNYSTERLNVDVGFPSITASYALQPERVYVSGLLATGGANSIVSVFGDYLPLPGLDLTLGYTMHHLDESYGLLNNETEVARNSQSIDYKAQYKYFYLQSSYYFFSSLQSFDIKTGNKTGVVNKYREKPYGAITIGAISYPQ